MDPVVTNARPPAVAWTYGLLGLAPFAATACGAVVTHGLMRSLLQLALLIYGALILTFLGGARWGLEIRRSPVRAPVISGSMAGAIVSTLLIALPTVWPPWRLLAMAAAHLAQWGWDVRATDTPPWYPRLRHVLTAGAVTCLVLGAAASLRP